MKAVRWLLAGTLVGLLGFLVLFLRPTPQLPSLNLGLDGCGEVELGQDGRTVMCTLDPLVPPTEQSIRILVREATDAVLAQTCDGCDATPCRSAGDPALASEPITSTLCLEVRPGRGTRQQARLTLQARQKTIGARTVRFVVPPRTEVDNLQQRWRATNGHLDQVRALLPEAQALADKPPMGERRDRAQILVAKIRYDELRALEPTPGTCDKAAAEPMEHKLRAALQVALRRGWFRSAADLGEALTWYYRYRPDAVNNITALLDDRPWLALLPAQKIESYRLLAGAALANQDLRRARAHLVEARADAEALHDATLFRALLEMRTLYLEQLALTASKDEVAAGLAELEAAVKKAATACDQAYVWGSIGWIRLRLLELGWPEAQDALPALYRAKELRTSSCREPSRSGLANVWVNIARAKSAFFWRHAEPDIQSVRDAGAATQAALDAMTAALGSEPMSAGLHSDQLLVLARLQLLNNKPQQALASMEELLRIASANPLMRWFATVHKAEAQEAAGQPAAALTTFREAENQLVTLQGQVPIYQSHRLMLERYEYSSQRAVELALRAGRSAEALEVLRQASQRALGLTMTPWWGESAATADPRWAKRRAEQEDYLKRRQSYESELASPRGLTAAQCQELSTSKSRWLSGLDALFRDPAPERFTPPVLPPAELLIGCVQQPASWVCIGALDGTLQVIPIPRRELNAAAMEQVVLPALAQQVQRSVKIRVLAHGALAQLDLAALQFLGKPLGTLKPIRFTVDRPPPPAQSAPRQALVVINPEDNIGDLALDTAHQLLAPALRGLAVTARSATADFATPPLWNRGEAHSTEVLADMQRSNILVYFGHVDPMPCQTQTPLCPASGDDALQPDQRLTALCLLQHTALSAGDLLAAPRVPQRAFLLGCSSADRSVTTPMEMLGLAQALALRGSQVLAISRRMPAAQAAEVLCAVGLQDLTDPHFDMDRFVMDTQSRLYRGERCAARRQWHTPQCTQGRCADVDWSALRSYGP